MPKRILPFEIDIKLCEQDLAKNDCVPACIKSVLDTCYSENNISKEEIGKLLGHSTRQGTALGPQLGKLKNLNRQLRTNHVPFEFKTSDKYEVRNHELNDVLRPTSKGLPAICTMYWKRSQKRLTEWRK